MCCLVFGCDDLGVVSVDYDVGLGVCDELFEFLLHFVFVNDGGVALFVLALG